MNSLLTKYLLEGQRTIIAFGFLTEKFRNRRKVNIKIDIDKIIKAAYNIALPKCGQDDGTSAAATLQVQFGAGPFSLELNR